MLQILATNIRSVPVGEMHPHKRGKLRMCVEIPSGNRLEPVMMLSMLPDVGGWSCICHHLLSPIWGSKFWVWLEMSAPGPWAAWLSILPAPKDPTSTGVWWPASLRLRSLGVGGMLALCPGLPVVPFLVFSATGFLFAGCCVGVGQLCAHWSLTFVSRQWEREILFRMNLRKT